MTRRSPGMGGYRQRGDGRYIAYRTVRGHRLTRYAAPNTEAGARRALRDLNRDVDRALARGETLRGRGRTLDQIAEDYFAALGRQVAEGERSPNTLHTYLSVYRARIAPQLGHRRAPDLRVAEVEDWLAALERPKRAYALAVLRAILADAERREEVSRNVARIARTTHTPARVPAPITPLQARRILEAAAGSRYAVAIQLALTTGMRRGEIVGLRWPNVDLDAGQIAIVEQRRAVPPSGRAPDGGAAEQAPTKSKRVRTVAIGPLARDALVAQRQRQRAERLQAGRRWQDSGHVVTTRHGAPLSGQGLSEVWRALARVHGLGDVRLHDLRHAWSTLAHAEGISDETRAAVLGHTRVQQTHGYTEVAAGLLQQAAAAVERALEG